MKYTMLLMAVIITPSSAAQYECIRWTWTGNSENRKVVCLEWRDKDILKKTEKKK